MRHFVLFAGIPCLMYGAGDVRLAHYTDEFVPIDEVVARRPKRSPSVLADWCGVSG